MVSIAVVIPVYKYANELNAFERSTVNNNLKKLFDLDLYFAGPQHLAASYHELFGAVKFTSFPSRFFKNISGYNQLLKSTIFYERFYCYTHILIAQTDAWVFGNSNSIQPFLKWDFAGAPSVLNNKLRGYNGGLSLRNVKACLAVLQRFQYVSKPAEIIKRHINEQSWLKVLSYKWMSVLLDLTIRNNFMYPLNRFVHDNEDIFWSNFAASRNPQFQVITYEESVKFAWEHNLTELYQQYPLPFGIHGWWNYNLSFWKKAGDVTLLNAIRESEEAVK